MKLLKLVPDDTNLKFLKWRWPFFIVSMILIAASWALVATKGLNYGVDFAGGQEVRVTFEQREEAPIAALREQITTLGYGEPVIQRFGAENQVSIRVRLPEEAESQRSEEHTSELQSLMRISYAVFCLKKKTKNKKY